MEEAAQAQQPGYTTLHRHRSHETTPFHLPLRVADAARSAKTISLWKSYLPAACVRTMTTMGWTTRPDLVCDRWDDSSGGSR
jgi:hypothetical protein